MRILINHLWISSFPAKLMQGFYKRNTNWLQDCLGTLFLKLLYSVKTRVGFENAEMTISINYISSYPFALKNINLKILEFSRVHPQWSNLFIKLLNPKLLMSNFSAEIFIFKYFGDWFNTVLSQSTFILQEVF